MYENGQLMVLNIDDILPNRFQPRIRFDEIKLEELSESIRKYGVIQPIVVRPIGGKYEIIAGERRFKASKIAGKTTIPAIVINLSDKDSEEIALLENVQRQELTAIEEAVSYKRILDMGYITQEGLAEKIGKSQSTIANKIRLLNLDDTVQDALLHGRISERHARSLLRIGKKEAQEEMLNRIIDERLTVKRTDDAIKEYLLKHPEDGNKGNKKIVHYEPKVNSFKTEVENLFDEKYTKDVSIDNKEKGEGFMDIDKIMKEAQDINASTGAKSVNDIADLMKQPGGVVNQTVTPPASDPTTEENKFVNLNIPKEGASKEEVSTPTLNTNSSVSFDSIFNQTPTNVSSVQSNAEQAVNNTITNPMVNNNSAPVLDNVTPPVSNVAIPNQASATTPLQDDVTKNMTNNNQAGYHVIGSNEGLVGATETQKIEVPENINNVPESVNNVNMAEQTQNLVPPMMSNTPIPEINSSTSIPYESNLNMNIPSAEIKEEVTPNVVQNVATASTNTHNFSEVINAIRNCAAQVEKMGYYINVDELDLGGTYQVTFKINKE